LENQLNNVSMNCNKNTTTFDEYLTNRYGKLGTETRSEFESKAKSYVLEELLKEAKQNHLNDT
jgi:hypothetical protein